MLNSQQKQEILKIAREAIALYLDKKEALKLEPDDPELKKPKGVFVTLYKGSRLRGCIGNIIAAKPLYLEVIEMAIAAATEDPRFSPLKKAELDEARLEVSVLSPLKKVNNIDEVILGTHGVLVKAGPRSGVYLPQVATETGWSKEEFMNSLCAHKAGLVPDAWKKKTCQIYVFTACVFGE